jgi:hypothetical protein
VHFVGFEGGLCSYYSDPLPVAIKSSESSATEARGVQAEAGRLCEEVAGRYFVSLLSFIECLFIMPFGNGPVVVFVVAVEGEAGAETH